MIKTIHDIEKKIEFTTILLILSVSAVLTHGYFNRVDKLYYESRLELHNQIIAGTAPPPYRYRILVPFIGEALKQSLSAVISLRSSFVLAYIIYDLLSISFILMALYFWLRTWFSSKKSLIGVLFVAGTMPVALQDHYYQPWSLLEPGLFSVALWAIYRKKYWLLACLVAIATLNRETGIFIPLAFLLTIDVKSLLNTRNSGEWQSIFVFVGLLLIWAIIFFGLRYFLGKAPHIETIERLLTWNTKKENLLNAFLNGSLFLGWFWLFGLLGYRYAPTFVKRVGLIVPIYLLIIIIWGVWYEVRLLMSLYPILMLLGMFFVYAKERKFA